MSGKISLWDPFSELRGFLDFGLPTLSENRLIHWDETGKGIVATLELPGLEKDSIKVDVEESKVTVSIEQKEELNDKTRFAARYQNFIQAILMPEGVKADDVTAVYKDGLLKIFFPQNKKEAKKRSLKIN